REATERLEVSYPTLRRWEARGLKRYTPPIADTKTVYYKVTDLLAFLGVEE
ncbi:MerR family transcriptional regulator, partial [Streptococcus lutetiensis]